MQFGTKNLHPKATVPNLYIVYSGSYMQMNYSLAINQKE